MFLSHSLDTQINVVVVFAFIYMKNHAFNQHHIPCSAHYTCYITFATQHTDKERDNNVKDTFYEHSHSFDSGSPCITVRTSQIYGL